VPICSARSDANKSSIPQNAGFAHADGGALDFVFFRKLENKIGDDHLSGIAITDNLKRHTRYQSFRVGTGYGLAPGKEFSRFTSTFYPYS
jgi:hypothetical protein